MKNVCGQTEIGSTSIYIYGLLLCSMYMVSMRIPINEDPMIL